MSADAGTSRTTKGRKPRSPNYPGIDLGGAVGRAVKLCENEQAHTVPTQFILDEWGYKPKSGGGGVAYAALKRFGLFEEKGRGSASLSNLGLEIVRAEQGDGRDYDKLRQAALLPKVH